MNLENVIPKETSQTQKDKYCVIAFIWNIQNKQIRRDRKQSRDYQGLGGGEWGATTTSWRISVWDDEKAAELDIGAGCTAL